MRFYPLCRQLKPNRDRPGLDTAMRLGYTAGAYSHLEDVMGDDGRPDVWVNWGRKHPHAIHLLVARERYLERVMAYQEDSKRLALLEGLGLSDAYIGVDGRLIGKMDHPDTA